MGTISREDDFGIAMKVRYNNEETSDFVMEKIQEEINGFTKRHNMIVGESYVGMDLRKTHIKTRGIPEYECRINLITSKGSFYASEKGIGAVHAVNECLSDLSSQIHKKAGKYSRKKRIRKEEIYEYGDRAFLEEA